MSATKYTNSPYGQIPEELIQDYTMGGKIPLFDWYFNNSVSSGSVQWSDEVIDNYRDRFTPENIRANNHGHSPYGNEPCVNLLNAFEKYNITDKKVAVVGSEIPWIEALLINLQNKVTTIEYNVPVADYDNLECKDYFDFFINNDKPFDTIVTFSSIEHSGLGRYGDPLDPDGDIKTMKDIYNNLKDGGLLIWGAPVGKDALTWNAHRVYGEVRLPLLFGDFKEVEWLGRNKEDLLNAQLENNGYQPVVVLQK